MICTGECHMCTLGILTLSQELFSCLPGNGKIRIVVCLFFFNGIAVVCLLYQKQEDIETLTLANL